MNRLSYLRGFSLLLSLTLAVAAAWVYWKQTPPEDAWVLDESERIITDLVPGEKQQTSFHLHNKGRLPRRILGCQTC